MIISFKALVYLLKLTIHICSPEIQRFFGIDKQPANSDSGENFNYAAEEGHDVDDGINLGISHNKTYICYLNSKYRIPKSLN